MVQFLPQRPKFAQAFGEAFAQGIGEAPGQVMDALEKFQERKKTQKEQDVLSRVQAGEDVPATELKALSVPSLLKLQEIQSKQNKDLLKSEEEKNLEFRDYDTIKDTFGEKFANIWRTTPKQGRTGLIKGAIEHVLRGDNLDDLLKDIKTENVQEDIKEPQEKLKVAQEAEEIIPNEIPQMKNGELPKNFTFPDFAKRPKGFTPKEWRDEKKGWRKENVPIFENNSKQLTNLRDDIRATKNLTRINERKQLPEGLSKILIDPETGGLRTTAKILELGGTDAQEWEKEIARFQNRAKDAFGSRVTNFDLVSYMRQFPNLLNTYEGRKRILDMLNINYELDYLYSNALDKIYKKAGIGNIPQEVADELAQKMIQKERDRLENEYLTLYEKNLEETEKENTFEELPPASQHAGRSIVDEETGQTYKSDGKTWRKV